MVPLTDRLCTPEQAIYFKHKRVPQLSCYAWERIEGGKYGLVFENDDVGLPKIVDWANAEGDEAFAAFDNTDLGLLLAELGYYPSGPSLQLPNNELFSFRWWCDDIQTFTSIEDSLYQGYGHTEAEAKGNMLMKLLQSKSLEELRQAYREMIKNR